MTDKAIEQIRQAAQQCINEWRDSNTHRTFQWIDDKFPKYHTGDIEINYYFHINWIMDWNITNREGTAIVFLEQWIKDNANLKQVIKDTEDWKLEMRGKTDGNNT